MSFATKDQCQYGPNPPPSTPLLLQFINADWAGTLRQGVGILQQTDLLLKININCRSSWTIYPLVFLFAYLTNQRVENIIDIVAETSRSFIKRTSELGSQQSSFLRRDCPLLLQIQLVCNQHQGNILCEAHPANQFSILAGLLEGPPIRNGITNDKSFPATHVLVSHRCELHLTCGVQYIQHRRLAIDNRLLLICILCNYYRFKVIISCLSQHHNDPDCQSTIRNKLWHSPIVGSW